MPLAKLPVTGLDDINHRRRARETLNQVLDHTFDDSRVTTTAEKLADVTPINKAFPPGDVRRFGAVTNTDCTAAIQASINTARTALIPENFTALISDTLDIAAAGVEIAGVSRFTSILQVAAGFTATSMIANKSQASGTSYGASIHDLYFKAFSGSTNINVICVDLASLNNCTVRRCRFEGVSAAFASLPATGVRFAAPIAVGSYANNIENCDFTNMGFGVLVADGGNNNTVTKGEFISCAFGIHAAPGTATDSFCAIGPRFEGCDIGLFEGTKQSTYVDCRFENQTTADIKFNANSQDCSFFGGLTAVTGTTLLNMNLAMGLTIACKDFYGFYSNSNSASRPNELIGPNVMAPLNDTGSTVNPAGTSAVALYLRNGRLCMDNQVDIIGRNVAGTGFLFMLRSDNADRIMLGAAGEDVRFGRALIPLGGGAAPTLGTIGGTGPATAAQNTWMKLFDSGGNAFYLPVWK